MLPSGDLLRSTIAGWRSVAGGSSEEGTGTMPAFFNASKAVAGKERGRAEFGGPDVAAGGGMTGVLVRGVLAAVEEPVDVLAAGGCATPGT